MFCQAGQWLVGSAHQYARMGSGLYGGASSADDNRITYGLNLGISRHHILPDARPKAAIQANDTLVYF